MKTIFGGIGILTLAIVMGLCLGFGIQAYASSAPTGDCNDLEWGCPDGATLPFTLEDMGVFVGTTFTWDDNFKLAYGEPLSWNHPDWMTTLAPYIQDGITYIPGLFGAGCREEVCIEQEGNPGFFTCNAEPIECPVVYDPAIDYYDMVMTGGFTALGGDPEPPADIDMEALCPCNDDGWKNHGKYVRCVAHESEEFVFQGDITEEEGDALVSEAAQSQCGK